MIALVIILSIYLTGSVLAYGAIFAHLQNRYQAIAKKAYKEDRQFAVYFAFWSWAGLILCVVLGDVRQTGFKWK